MCTLQTQTFRWVGSPILGDREAEHSPKQVHLVLKPKPHPPNSLNCVMIAIKLPAASISQLLPNLGGENGPYSLASSNSNIYFPMYFPKMPLVKDYDSIT